MRGLGAWLSVNGGAVYGSRPWVVAESRTAEGVPVRFTCRGDVVYALVIGTPKTRRISLPDVDSSGVTRVRLVGHAEPIEWVVDDGVLTVGLAGTAPSGGGHGARPRRRVAGASRCRLPSR